METKEYSMMMNDSDIDIVQKMAKDSEENDTYEFEVVLENVQETSKNSWFMSNGESSKFPAIGTTGKLPIFEQPAPLS